MKLLIYKSWSELVQLEPDEEIATDILKNSNKLQKEVEKFEISTFYQENTIKIMQ